MSAPTYTLVAPPGISSSTLHGLSKNYTVDANGYVTNVTQADTALLILQGYTALPPVGEVLLGTMKAANFNSTADQVITLSTAGLGSATSKVYINRIVVDANTIPLTTAAGGIYTQPAKAGVAIVASGQVYSGLSGTNQAIELTIAAKPTMVPPALVYLALTTAQGAAATADVYVFGSILP